MKIWDSVYIFVWWSWSFSYFLNIPKVIFSSFAIGLLQWSTNFYHIFVGEISCNHVLKVGGVHRGLFIWGPNSIKTILGPGGLSQAVSSHNRHSLKYIKVNKSQFLNRQKPNLLNDGCKLSLMECYVTDLNIIIVFCSYTKIGQILVESCKKHDFLNFFICFFH